MSATLLASAVACGRIDFAQMHADARLDGRISDAPSDAAPARCRVEDAFTSIQAVTELNSPMLDGALRLSADELTAYFHSTRAGGLAQLWTASRARSDLPFDPPVSLLTDPNGSFWPTVSADGLTLIYNDQSSPLRALRATRAATTQVFGTATPVTALAGLQVVTSVLADADQVLYFTSKAGGMSIESVPVGPYTPATTYGELGQAHAPALSPDQLLIYFATSTAPFDIYVAERANTSLSFGPPRVIPELGSSMVQNPTWLSMDLCRLYFESNRAGSYDVYVAARAPR